MDSKFVLSNYLELSLFEIVFALPLLSIYFCWHEHFKFHLLFLHFRYTFGKNGSGGISSTVGPKESSFLIIYFAPFDSVNPCFWNHFPNRCRISGASHWRVNNTATLRESWEMHFSVKSCLHWYEAKRPARNKWNNICLSCKLGKKRLYCWDVPTIMRREF